DASFAQQGNPTTLPSPAAGLYPQGYARLLDGSHVSMWAKVDPTSSDQAELAFSAGGGTSVPPPTPTGGWLPNGISVGIDQKWRILWVDKVGISLGRLKLEGSPNEIPLPPNPTLTPRSYSTEANGNVRVGWGDTTGHAQICTFKDELHIPTVV